MDGINGITGLLQLCNSIYIYYINQYGVISPMLILLFIQFWQFVFLFLILEKKKKKKQNVLQEM